MKRYLLGVFCSALLLAGGTLNTANAQGSKAAAQRHIDIAKAGADTYLTIHPFYDNALQKIHALKYRKPGDPHPLVSKDNLMRFLTIIRECTDAELALVSGS